MIPFRHFSLEIEIRNAAQDQREILRQEQGGQGRLATAQRIAAELRRARLRQPIHSVPVGRLFRSLFQEVAGRRGNVHESSLGQWPRSHFPQNCHC